MLAVVLQHINAAPRPPSQLRPDISPATDEVVLRALAKDPAARFQTAEELREAIEQARVDLDQVSSVVYIRAATPPASSLAPTQRVAPRHAREPLEVNEVAVTRKLTTAPPLRRGARPTSSGWSLVWLVPLGLALGRETPLGMFVGAIETAGYYWPVEDLRPNVWPVLGLVLDRKSVV